ncbi:MAG: LacI family DNA-binding transcriptional regulator [Christensenellales bacterium]|jgi:LacI family repressor for deo operon, udp, cdd, tsx, nupC, and nupG
MDNQKNHHPPHKRVTRKDIADMLGVSVSVVSRALNNSGYVKKETRRKILSLAEQLHYTPNPIAMTLQQRKTRQIMFVCKDLHNSFNIDLYYGMLNVAEERGYMILLNGKLDFALIRETLIDGIILPNDYAAYEYDQRCGKTYYLPAVSAGFGNRFPMSKAMPIVEWDLYKGMEAAIAYLRERGHTKIAYACSDSYRGSDPRTIAWHYLMRDELGDRLPLFHLGINSIDSNELPGKDMLGTVEEREFAQEEEDFFEHGLLAAKVFQERKLDATAIICFNDEMGFGVLQGLLRLGIHVPQDISLVSFDGCYRLPQTSPRLSSVTCEPMNMGAMLADQLIRIISGEEYRYVNRIPSYVLEGESVKHL